MIQLLNILNLLKPRSSEKPMLIKKALIQFCSYLYLNLIKPILFKVKIQVQNNFPNVNDRMARPIYLLSV